MSASSASARVATAAVASAEGGRDTQQQQQQQQQLLLELQQRVADALRQMDDEQTGTQNGRSAPTDRRSDATTSAAAMAAAAVSALPPAPQPALAAQSSRSWSQRSDSRVPSPPSPAPAARERLWTYLAQLPLAGVIDQRDMDALLRCFNSAEQAIAEIEKRNLHRSRPAWAPPLQMEQLMALIGVDAAASESEDDDEQYLALPGAADRAAHSSDSAAGSAAILPLPLQHASATTHFADRRPNPQLSAAHSISELDRQSARTSLRECGIMSHAADSAECSDEQLHRMIDAAQGVSTLQLLLVEMVSRSVQPQCAAELVFLVELAARNRFSTTRRTLAQQMALARVEVDRADRAAAGRSRSVSLLSDVEDENAEPLPLEQLMDENEPFPLEPGGFEQQMAVLRARLERWADRRNITDWVRGPGLTALQRRSVVVVMLAHGLLDPIGADAADIGQMDLDQLLPPVCSSFSTSHTRLLAALRTLGQNRVRARSFAQLVDMIRQHWAHAVPRLHAHKENEGRTRTRDADDRDRDNDRLLLDEHNSCACVVQ